MAQDAAEVKVDSVSVDRDYVRDIVRAADQDRYWAGLLMPLPAREHLFALYAFNIELARIGEQVREPQLGEIRLEWWREALALGSGEVTGNPVADALRSARDAYGLPDEPLADMIDARSLDVQRQSLATMEELRGYLLATAGGVFRLGAWIAGARDANAARTSEEAAMAYGLIGLMRALPYHAARGQLYLPADFLGAFGVDAAAVLAGEASEGVRTALGVLRERAREHLARFRRYAAELPSASMPVFLPLVLAPAYLRRMGHASHRPLGEVAELNPLSRYARIWLAGMRGRV